MKLGKDDFILDPVPKKAYQLGTSRFFGFIIKSFLKTKIGGREQQVPFHKGRRIPNTTPTILLFLGSSSSGVTYPLHSAPADPDLFPLVDPCMWLEFFK